MIKYTSNRVLMVCPAGNVPIHRLKNVAHTDNKSKFYELIIILNPNSQGGATGKNWNETYSLIKDFLPKHHRIIFTKKPNDGMTVTRKLLKEGYRNIVALGGDGTINEIANGFFDIKLKNNFSIHDTKFRPASTLNLINPKGICWISPSGTRNVLAASLGLPHQGNEALMRIRHMKKRKIDVIGVVATDKENHNVTHNRIVLNAAEIGVGAEIIDRSKKVRNKVKSRILSTVAGIVSTLPTYESNECDIIIDRNKKITTKVTMAVIANGKFLGGKFKAAPRADFSDGLLDLIIMKNSGSFKMLDELIEMKSDNEYSKEEDILYYQGSEVKIISKERDVTVSLDGEPVGILPAVFKVYHNAMSIKTEPTQDFPYTS
jgi:diacylglycerol kinase family enzyme